MNTSVNSYAQMDTQELLEINLSTQDDSNNITMALDRGDQLIDELNQEISSIEQQIIDNSKTQADAKLKTVKDLKEKRRINKTKCTMIENKVTRLNALWQ